MVRLRMATCWRIDANIVQALATEPQLRSEKIGHANGRSDGSRGSDLDLVALHPHLITRDS